MAKRGYSYVSERGFIAFNHDLQEGAWKDISIATYDVPDQMPAQSLLEAPAPVAWKLRATWAIRSLTQLIGVASPEEVAVLDGSWDSSQRKAYHHLGSAAEDSDPAVREAAERLRSVLLSGAGIAQTILSYDDEVDYGRQQLQLVTQEPLAADVKKVGLQEILDRINETTEALAHGIGRGPGQKKSAARSIRLRETLTECSSSFNAIHEEILWMEEHTPAGPIRTLLEDLRRPFEALLSRSPPPAKAEEPAEPGADQQQGAPEPAKPGATDTVKPGDLEPAKPGAADAAKPGAAEPAKPV